MFLFKKGLHTLGSLKGGVYNSLQRESRLLGTSFNGSTIASAALEQQNRQARHPGSIQEAVH